MKKIYDAPEFKVISLMAKSAMCAGDYDGVYGGQDEDEIPTLSNFNLVDGE